MVPIGSIIAYVGTLEALKADNPDFLPAEGQELRSRDYKHLARALGATGETIRLPDMRGRFLKGTEENGSVSESGGTKTHSHPAHCANNDHPQHRHHDGGGHTGNWIFGVHDHAVSVTEMPHEPPFTTVRWIVRVR